MKIHYRSFSSQNNNVILMLQMLNIQVTYFLQTKSFFAATTKTAYEII